MTRSQKLALIACFIIAAILGFNLSRFKKNESSSESPTAASPRARTFIGPDRQPLPTPPVDVKVENVASNNWHDRVRDSFRKQAPSVKDITITVEQSYVLVQGTNAINVESVKIILTNQRGEESSFRALVDSQTGKVIETWDRSLTDPMNPRDTFKLKLDPRYQQTN